MKRFVSYLYSIYNNQKIHNAGFARVELRSGRNRIDIHLQENGYTGKNGTVYLFVRGQENIQGISIGNITFRNNQADFRYEQPEENIGQTSWQIMQMNGIAVLIDGRVAFLSQWDEQPVDTNKFEVWNLEQIDGETSDGETSAETDSNRKEGTMPKAASKSDEAGRNPLTSQREDTATNNSLAGQREDNSAANPLNGQNAENSANNFLNGQNAENSANNFLNGQNAGNSANNFLNGQNAGITADNSPASQAAGDVSGKEQPAQPSTIHTAEIQPQANLGRAGWEQTWRYMLRRYPVLNQFDDSSNVLCVRIEIKDVRLLPEKYWSMVNNSFLLHGFFNYRHLVFGRIGQSWFIGIPGIYQNQEHAMASIFGFPDFLPETQKNERGEQPGYWYRVLEI